jgi:hypothetical protein
MIYNNERILSPAAGGFLAKFITIRKCGGGGGGGGDDDVNDYGDDDDDKSYKKQEGMLKYIP